MNLKYNTDHSLQGFDIIQSIPTRTSVMKAHYLIFSNEHFSTITTKKLNQYRAHKTITPILGIHQSIIVLI